MGKSNLNDMDLALINTLFQVVADKLEGVEKAISSQIAILHTMDELVKFLTMPDNKNMIVYIYVGTAISFKSLKLVVSTGEPIFTPQAEMDIVISSDWSNFKWTMK